MENKKTKLTISGNPRKTFKKFDTSKSRGKKTVIIEKNQGKFPTKGIGKKPFLSKSPSYGLKRGLNPKQSFPDKISSTPSDFERRKLA